ncbi:MAG: hypothetical protein ACJ8AD_14380 [Gemmatimonadaceae bacterium]
MPLVFRLRRLALPVCLALAGCREASPSAALPPPAADFILSAGDSSFWVTSHAGKVRMRGAPLQLARLDGRLYELYVADDDRSFEDAILVGQRVYRRDLVTGDSVLVYQDTLVPHLARLYGQLHPDDQPLRPNDQASDDPLWTATSQLDLDAVAGPFVSFSMHTDVERDDAPLWHTSRRGVLDIRAGRPATLAAVTGRAQADVERMRARVLRSTLDSVRASRDARGARAAALLHYYRLDPASFSLTTIDGIPAVAYAVPGAGGGDAGHLLALAPIPIGEPAWWTEAASTFPISSVDGARDVWRHGSYEVVVRYDPTNGAGGLSLRDSTSREWALGRVPPPASRILWLDKPPVDSMLRRALDRAFEESSLYDDAVRTASFRPAPRRRNGPRHLQPRHSRQARSAHTTARGRA